MVPVRKPGRPLSSCPHPASKPCNCGTVTAAIPRRQTCGCGTSNSTTPQSKAETEETSPATSPDEPRPTPTPSTTSSSSNFRVQKTKGGSNRKMSIDPASLDRMDSNQLNVLPSPSSYGGNGNGLPTGSMGMPNGHIPAMAGLNHYPVMGMQGAEHAFSPQPIMFPLFHPHMPSPMMGAAPAPAPTPAPSVKSLKTSSASTQPAVGSCCGGGAVEKRNSESSQSDASPEHSSTPQPSNQRTNGEAPKGSCCSSKPASNDLSPGTLTPPEHVFPSPNEMMMAPFQHQLAALANGMYGLFPQPTVFTYPPQYGTFMQPLQPEQWRQVMASIAFGQMAQPHPGFDMSASMAGAVPFSTITNPHSGTSHRCSCGDGCQCVGCAAHPYNEATQNYVRSAWSSMTEEANGVHTPHANGNHAMANGHNHSHNHNHDHHHNHHGHNGLNGSHVDTASVTDPALTDANGGQSSAQQESGTSTGPQTPSDAPSSITEEQALSASDFFFVTYPFGDSCAGETASCPCGDDCQCIGCVIHNNPAPE